MQFNSKGDEYAARVSATYGGIKYIDCDKKDEEDDWEDVDEHEKDVFDKDGYFNVPDE